MDGRLEKGRRVAAPRLPPMFGGSVMSNATRYRTWVALLAALLALSGGAARAQEADPQERLRQLREVEAQRVEKEFKEGRDYAYRAIRTNPTRAFDRIQTLLE